MQHGQCHAHMESYLSDSVAAGRPFEVNPIWTPSLDDVPFSARMLHILVRRSQVGAHRRLRMFGAGLAAVMVVLGVMTPRLHIDLSCRCFRSADPEAVAPGLSPCDGVLSPNSLACRVVVGTQPGRGYDFRLYARLHKRVDQVRAECGDL